MLTPEVQVEGRTFHVRQQRSPDTGMRRRSWGTSRHEMKPDTVKARDGLPRMFVLDQTQSRAQPDIAVGESEN